jgi:anaerobic selenocysteine-containing dehydrogenase
MGLTNEAYYAHQKVARFLGTNHVDTSSRICHAPSTDALKATVGCAATPCSYKDWIGADLIVSAGLSRDFPTPDGKGHFSAVDLPNEFVPDGHFLLSTRRGKQFNSIVHSNVDPLTGASRDDILMCSDDAKRLRLRTGDPVIRRNELGDYRGRVKIDRIRPGCLQAHWPEANGIVSTGRLDVSGSLDYNAAVERVPVNDASRPKAK